MLARAQANATAEIHVPVPEPWYFEREKLNRHAGGGARLSAGDAAGAPLARDSHTGADGFG